MSIHSTAIIHPEAQIAEDAEVGAYVCIEGPSVVGSGCVLQPHSILTGSVRMGEKNLVGYGAVIGASPQALSYQPGTKSEVIIGNGNTIREYCTIHRGLHDGGATRVGDDNFLMAGVHLGHDTVLGNHNIIANNCLLGGHVEVANRVFIGGGSVFHQFIRIGELVVVQGNSSMSKDIPPFTLAAERNFIFGLNIVGLRRAGLTAQDRGEIKEAFKMLYQSGLNTAQTLALAREREWSANGRLFFDFVESAKKRGICALAATRETSIR